MDIEKYRDAIGDLNLCVGNINDNPEYLVNAVKWQMNRRTELEWLRSRLKDAIDYAEDEMMSGYQDFDVLLKECKRIVNKTKPTKPPRITDEET